MPGPQMAQLGVHPRSAVAAPGFLVHGPDLAGEVSVGPGTPGRPRQAMKCLYLAIMSLDPTGKGRKRWTNRWKAALNAFDITFDGRLSAGRK